MGSVSTSIWVVRFTLNFLGGNEWFLSPRHSVCGSVRLSVDFRLVVWKGERPRLRLVDGLVERLSRALSPLPVNHQEAKALKRKVPC